MKTAQTDRTYCSADDCHRANECARHKQHWRFDPEKTIMYWWVDFTRCQERMVGFFVPLEEAR